MKLLEKLKNTFFEEEYVEIDEDEKEEVVAKKVEPKEIKKEVKKVVVEEVEDLDEEEPTINYSDSELIKKDSKVPYFEDDDFIEEEVIKNKKEEPKKLYGESADKIYDAINYTNVSSNKPYGAPIKGAFQPTPIISPIYGILDKNYRKEEVVDKRPSSSYVSRRNVDLDSVRKKAYGGIDYTDNINNSVEEEVENEFDNDNLLYDMTDNTTPVVDEVTIADAEEYFEDLGLEYNIDYKDNHYEKATGRRTNTKKKKQEIVQENEEANLEDNLFDLIDSKYDEEGDEE